MDRRTPEIRYRHHILSANSWATGQMATPVRSDKTRQKQDDQQVASDIINDGMDGKDLL